MKNHVPLSLQANRVRHGQMASDESYGLAGMFKLIGPTNPKTKEGGALLLVMSSGPADRAHHDFNDTGWEHVSVTAEGRCPTWPEMCFVKDMFWTEDECAVQYHPPRSEYVNYHPHCLHMWKPVNMTIPMPPLILIGPRTR